MRIEEREGTGSSYLRCYKCTKRMIFERIATNGLLTQEQEDHLISRAEYHENRHPSHEVTVMLYRKK